MLQGVIVHITVQNAPCGTLWQCQFLTAARSVFLETQWVSGLCGGASWTINGKALWPQFLLDFGLALLFRLVFQYLNVAPMTGN